MRVGGGCWQMKLGEGVKSTTTRYCILGSVYMRGAPIPPQRVGSAKAMYMHPQY